MGIGAVRAALLVASALAFFHAVPATTPAAQVAHGRELVAQFELPADQLALYRAQAERGAPARSAQASWADPTLWTGPLQAVGIGRNPYTLVLSVSGTAPAAGDVRTHWHAGWEVHESPVATRELLMPLAALSSGSVNAGTPLTLTVVGSPVSFRGERQVAPMLNLVQAQNFELQAVRLAVWSGSAPLAWPQPTAPQLAMALLGGLCALAWFALRRRPQPAVRHAATTLAPSSTLPQYQTEQPDVDLQGLLEHRSAAPAPAPVPAAVLPPALTPPIPSRAQQATLALAALRDVLTAGLAVPTELDDTRGRKRRRGMRTG